MKVESRTERTKRGLGRQWEITGWSEMTHEYNGYQKWCLTAVFENIGSGYKEAWTPRKLDLHLSGQKKMMTYVPDDVLQVSLSLGGIG